MGYLQKAFFEGILKKNRTMKKIFFFLLPIIIEAQSLTITPNSGSAILQTNSTNKAIKMPSVNNTTAISSPQKGMVVFDDATGTLSYYNGSQWIPLSNSTTGWAVNGNNLNNTNSGNTGIGESSPNAKLHVKTGSSGASAPAFTNSIFENSTHNVVSILSPDNTQSGLIMQRPTTGSGGVTYNTDESLSLIANGSARMDIESNGNVGIGTSSAATKLHINNGASGQVPHTNADLTIEDNGTALIQLLSPQAYDSGILFGLPSNVASGGILYNNGGKKSMQFRTQNNTTQMTIDSTGSVGIGTSTPITKVDIAGGLRVGDEIILGRSSPLIVSSSITFDPLNRNNNSYIFMNVSQNQTARIKGFDAAVNGTLLYLIVISPSSATTIIEISAASDASNNISTNNNSDITITGIGSAVFIYETGAWRLLSVLE